MSTAVLVATTAAIVAANAAHNSGPSAPMTPGQAMFMLACLTLCAIVGIITVVFRDTWTDRFTAFMLGFLGTAIALMLAIGLLVLIGTAAGY